MSSEFALFNIGGTNFLLYLFTVISLNYDLFQAFFQLPKQKTDSVGALPELSSNGNNPYWIHCDLLQETDKGEVQGLFLHNYIFKAEAIACQ